MRVESEQKLAAFRAREQAKVEAQLEEHRLPDLKLEMEKKTHCSS